MGIFLSQILDKLMGGEREAHTTMGEVDHNNCVFCGTVNIMEPDRSSGSDDDEKPCVKERKHGDKNFIH